MSKNEELKKITVEHNGETRTMTYSKELEESLMKYHGIVAADELKEAALFELKREQMRRDIDAIVHPLLSDPMDMNRMCATTDKIIEVFEKYNRV